MLIGITGNKRNGKDTIANYLVNDYNFHKYSFAESMKEASKIIFNWTENHVNGDLKEVIDDRWGISPRQWLQFLGSDVMQFDLPNKFHQYKEVTGRKHWAKLFSLWYENIKKLNTDIVIADCRFLHEVDELKKFGGIIIKVIKSDLNNIGDKHISEVELDQIQSDYIVYNDGTFQDLYNQIDLIICQEQTD